MGRAPIAATLAITLAIGAPALLGLGGYLLAKAPDIAFAQEELRRAALERALTHGFSGLAMGWHERAAADFDEALALDPRSIEAYAGLALARTGEADALVDRARAELGDVPVLERVRAYAALLERGEGAAAALPADAAAERSDPIELFVAGLLRLERELRRDERDLGATLDLLLDAILRSPS